MNPKDRILEYALEQHFAPAPVMDMSKDVAQRWAQGERGSLEAWELEGLLEDPSVPVQPADLNSIGMDRNLRSVLKKPWVQIACVAAGLVGVLFGLSRWGAPEPIPRATGTAPDPWHVQLSEPMTLLRGPELASVTSSVIQADDVIWASGGEHSMALADGLSLVVSAPALFSLTPKLNAVQVEVFAGDVELGLEPGSELLVNGLRLASIASSRVDLGAWDSTESTFEEEGITKSIAALRRGLRLGQETLLKISEGELRYSHSEREQVLKPGAGMVVLTDEAIIELPLWIEAQDLIQRIMPMGARRIDALSYWNMEGAMEQAADLGGLLEKESGLWGAIENALLAAIENRQLNRVHASVLLNLLVFSEEEKPLQIARALWMEAPGSFYPVHIASLSTRGLFEFEREVQAQLNHWRQDKTSIEQEPLLYAVSAALRRDSTGRDLLEEVLREASPSTIASGSFALASVGMEFLGDHAAWEMALEKSKLAFEEELEVGELASASALVARLEHLMDNRLDPRLNTWFWLPENGTVKNKPGLLDEEGLAIDLRSRLDALLGN